MGYCEVVEGSESLTGCTLKTYIYDVHSLDGSYYYGTYPPDWHGGETHFYYTLVGDGLPLEPWYLRISASPDFHPFLEWNASPSDDIYIYRIYRKVHGIDDDFILIGSVPVGTHQYEDTEYSTPHPGPIAYWRDDADYTVTAVDQGLGESDRPPFVTITVLVPARPYPKPFKQSSPLIEIPESFALYAAYPNPFNSQTMIKYALPEDAYVVIEIYNISGQKIETIISETKPTGYHEIIWDASNVASGTYLYKIKAGGFSEAKMLTLLK